VPVLGEGRQVVLARSLNSKFSLTEIDGPKADRNLRELEGLTGEFAGYRCMIRDVFKGNAWAVSRSRSIDDATIVDILGVLEFAAARAQRFEEAGEQVDSGSPNDNPIELLFVYVLDALGVPPAGAERKGTGEHPRFSRTLKFSREWFEELFYSDYLLEQQERKLTLHTLIERIHSEVASNLDRHYK